MVLLPKELQKYFSSCWYSALELEMNKDYFQNALGFLKEESVAKRAVYPKFKDMWRPWMLPIDKVRVVLLMDQPNKTSDGLALSTLSMNLHPDTIEVMTEIYFSLFQKASKGIGLEDCFCCGDLTQWHKQGVLLLNQCLTTGDDANQHKMFGWQQFTKKTIEILNKKEHPIVFILEKNSEYEKLIDSSKHEILPIRKIQNSKVFVECNSFLKARYPDKPTINWGVWINECNHYVVRILNENWKDIPRLIDQVKQEFRLPTYFKPMFEARFGKEWQVDLTTIPSEKLYDWFLKATYSEKLKSPKKGKELLFEEDNFLYWCQCVGRELCHSSVITISEE